MCFNRMNTTKSLTVLAFALLMTLPVAAQRPGFGVILVVEAASAAVEVTQVAGEDSVVAVEILEVAAVSAAAGVILADAVCLGAEEASIPVPF